MKSITFKKHYRCYNPGETAHFAINVANDLVAAGVACEVAAVAAAAADEDQPGKVTRKAQPKAANAQPD
ncbi:MAG: hypothetical protein NVSMB6_00100 [Burkholderiaceae bacterium]